MNCTKGLLKGEKACQKNTEKRLRLCWLTNMFIFDYLKKKTHSKICLASFVLPNIIETKQR